MSPTTRTCPGRNSGAPRVNCSKSPPPPPPPPALLSNPPTSGPRRPGTGGDHQNGPGTSLGRCDAGGCGYRAALLATACDPPGREQCNDVPGRHLGAWATNGTSVHELSRWIRSEDRLTTLDPVHGLALMGCTARGAPVRPRPLTSPSLNGKPCLALPRTLGLTRSYKVELDRSESQARSLHTLLQSLDLLLDALDLASH